MAFASLHRFSLVSLQLSCLGGGLLALLLVAVLPRGAVGQTVLLQETFENDGEGSRYDAFDENGSITTFSDGSDDYFIRTNGSSDIGGVGLAGPEGSFFFAGQDLDGEGNTPPLILELGSVSTNDFSNLTVKALFAEDDASNGEENWDSTDYLRLQYSTDGGSMFDNLICFAGNGSTNSEPGIDSNCDGTRDAGGTSLTNTFAEFSGGIAGSPSSVTLRVKADLNSGDEDFAIDNIRLSGTSSGPTVQFTAANGTVQESDGSTTLALEILNPPSGTEVTADVVFNGSASGTGSGDVNSFGTKSVTFPSSPSPRHTETVTVNLNSSDGTEGSEDAVFNLESVSNAGAVEGSPNQYTLTIQDAVAAHNGDVLITELMGDPGSVGSDGEYVELYNPTGSSINIEGWTLKDAADNTEILSDVDIPARGFVVLCRDMSSSANGGILNCDDSFSPALNNGSETVFLLDGGGAGVDTVSYSSAPDGASLVFTGTTDNKDATGSKWETATRRERGYAQDQGSNNGSPGRNGAGQILQPTAEVTGGAGWRMLAAPVGGVTPNDLAAVSLVQGISGLPFSGAAANLYQWPGGTDAAVNWSVPSDAATDLTGGGVPAGAAGGFIWYVFDAPATEATDTPPFTLSFPGQPRTSTVTTGALNSGFHLLGNPYSQSLDISALNLSEQGFQTTVQVWDASEGSYNSVTQSGTANDLIGPYQGFFVERISGSNPLTIDADGRRADPVSLKTLEKGPPRISFQIVGRSGDGEVMTRDEALTLHAPEGATMGWDVHDASKLAPLSGRYATAAFRNTTNSETRLQSVASIPANLPEEGIELPVSLQLQGTDPVETFRLSWPTWQNVPDHWGLALHDTVADTTINLRTHTSYTFALPQSKAQAVPPPRSPLKMPTRIRAKTASTDSARFLLTVRPTPLPVELATLEAVRVEDAVQLTWTTASETNNAGFYVEHRGPDTRQFASSGFVEGHGTTDRPQHYRFRTDALDPGRHTFRLQQVDLDGTTTRSDTVSVQMRLADAARITVAPNPIHRQGTVSLRVREEQSGTVALYDVLGRRVRTLHEGVLSPGRAHTLFLNVDGLASGLYFLRATGEQFQKTQRITVTR